MKAPIDAARGVRGERGAVFVQVGFAVFVLVSFNVFVLDYGIMWMSRRQAQNAADAGAFAGAVARNYDDFDDPPSSNGPCGAIGDPGGGSKSDLAGTGAIHRVVRLSGRNHRPVRSGGCASRQQFREPIADRVRSASGRHLSGRPGDGDSTGRQRERHGLPSAVRVPR